MSDTLSRALQRAVADDPVTPFDVDAVIAAARLRRRRRQAGALSAMPVLVALLIAGSVLPNAADGVRAAAGAVAAAAGLQNKSDVAVLRGRFDRTSIADGQEPAATRPAEVARTVTPSGQPIVMVGYRAQDGSSCLGFPQLPGQTRSDLELFASACGNLNGLAISGGSETGAAPGAARSVFGSLPRAATRLRVTAGSVRYHLPATTSDHPDLDDRVYVVALLPVGAEQLAYEALDEDDNVIARQDP